VYIASFPFFAFIQCFLMNLIYLTKRLVNFRLDPGWRPIRLHQRVLYRRWVVDGADHGCGIFCSLYRHGYCLF
jgi:hypothetical protein